MVTRAKKLKFHAERLNEKTRNPQVGKGCESLNTDRKTVREIRRSFPARKGQKSNRTIDARMSFYGTYVQLNEQVTLQSQDPVLNECAARLGVSLNILGDVKLNLNTLENLTACA